MQHTTEADPEGWIAAAARRRWLGRVQSALTPLKGDASARRFWRVQLTERSQALAGVLSPAPASAIAIDLGPDDLPQYVRALKLLAEPLPEPPWVNVHRFLTKIGAAVPAIYTFDPRARMLLVEDVGAVPLFEAALGCSELYRLAADQLVLLHDQGSRSLDDSCLAAHLAYDYRLFRWELEQFLEAGLEQVAAGADPHKLSGELDQLAARLSRFPRVFSHRDYHGHNLFVQSGEREARLRVIDFQDALMAPAAQDLAVLLTTRDAARVITPTVEQHLIDYYYAALLGRRVPQLPFEQFRESYQLCVLQHALKMVGRFVILERGGKRGYGVYIPFVLAQARRMLAQIGGFPGLRAVLCA